MSFSDLEKQFEEAYNQASNLSNKIPPDLMLNLYAYYKQAVKGDNLPPLKNNNNNNLINAFKLNAWVQVRGMSEQEAKQNYIELVKKIIKNI